MRAWRDPILAGCGLLALALLCAGRASAHEPEDIEAARRAERAASRSAADEDPSDDACVEGERAAHPDGDPVVALPEPAFGATARVDARSRPLTASTTRLDARDLASIPRRNAEDALRLVPGFVLVQHGSEGKGHQFFLRGFDAMHGADLEVTVEGIPLNEWSNIHAQGYLDLGLLIPEAITGVEVTKGPVSIDQGAFALAGSADYRLGLPPDDAGRRVGYTVGSTGRHRLVATYQPRGEGREAPRFVAAEALHDDGFGENRDIDRGALLARVRLFEHPRLGRLSLLAAGHLSRFGLPGVLPLRDVEAGDRGFFSTVDPVGGGRSQRGLLAAQYAVARDARRVDAMTYVGVRRLTLLENFTGFLVDPTEGDRRDQRHFDVTFGGDLSHSWVPSRRLRFETGIGLRGDALRQRQDRVGRATQFVQRERSLRATQWLAHTRVGLGYRPVRPLRLTLGGRLDVAHIQLDDRLHETETAAAGTRLAVSPRLVAEWHVVPSLRLLGAYGRGFRPPEARAFSSFEPARLGLVDDVYTGGAPDMTVVDALEVGVRYIPNLLFGASVAGFASFVDRETVFDHVSGINLELSGTRRIGVELSSHVDPVPWLTLRANATFVDARFEASGRRIPLVPAWVASSQAVATHPQGARAGLRLSGFSARPLPHGATGAPFASLDATVGYHRPHFRVDLSLENLLDRQLRAGEYHYASRFRPNREPGDLPTTHVSPGPPRNARLTLTWLP